MAELALDINCSPNDESDLGGKYLIFQIGDEEYGIGILKVREIICMMPMNKLPRAPKYYKGVINLRGKVIPIIDLKILFETASAKGFGNRCIIIIDRNGCHPVGMIVDSVAEVLFISSGDVQETPYFGDGEDTEYILGIARTDSGIRTLIDIDRLLAGGSTGLSKFEKGP